MHDNAFGVWSADAALPRASFDRLADTLQRSGRFRRTVRYELVCREEAARRGGGMTRSTAEAVRGTERSLKREERLQDGAHVVRLKTEGAVADGKLDALDARGVGRR
jgi:hypothetical protein